MKSSRLSQSKSARELLQLVAQQLLLEQLLAQPQRHRHAEGAEAARREGEIGFEQPLEFQERLVVEHDVIDVVEPRSCRLQAIGDRVVRETGIVLLAREAFFLRRGHDAAVLDQRRGAVVIEGGNAENAHRASRAQNSV